jgi:anti-anti-sigma factor
MTEFGSDSSRVDRQGILPARAYAIEERDAPAGVVLLALEGEFDLAAVATVRERFDAARAAGARTVVLDMTEVGFVDSSMLRELLVADTALRDAGGTLVLAAVNRPVIRLLELTHAIDLLAVAPSVEQAVASAAG